MTLTADSQYAAVFQPLRPKLVRLAYRMLGSMADAEDVAQTAYLRWSGAEPEAVREPEAFLMRIVARLSLDELKSARRRRERYVGPWLPEPLIDEHAGEADARQVALPLLLALERLSALERAAFLLHDIFDQDFDEVAQALGRTPAACRQLASRVRRRVRDGQPQSAPPTEAGLKLAQAFFTASRTGDLDGLRALLAEEVAVHADGGGLRPAAFRVLEGLEETMLLHAQLARRYATQPSVLVDVTIINGLPGFITREADGLQTTALRTEDGRITAVYVVRNPDKLARLEAANLGKA